MHCCETGQSDPRSMQFRILPRPARPTAGPWAHSLGWMLDSPRPENALQECSAWWPRMGGSMGSSTAGGSNHGAAQSTW
eukprot:9480668-Pyramimonas_sp.AAC.1